MRKLSVMTAEMLSLITDQFLNISMQDAVRIFLVISKLCFLLFCSLLLRLVVLVIDGVKHRL